MINANFANMFFSNNFFIPKESSNFGLSIKRDTQNYGKGNTN
jgi:hypothetical protein